jgi:hypothetical protein
VNFRQGEKEPHVPNYYITLTRTTDNTHPKIQVGGQIGISEVGVWYIHVFKMGGAGLGGQV